MQPTISTILEQHLDSFLATSKVPLYQLKALESYRACRTPALGSHSRYCENGHLMGVWYSSCRRRGCAQCQGLANARWLASQKERLLAVTHHHWIYTLPHELLGLWRYNRVAFQDLLFKSVAEVLTVLSGDRRYLGAQPGFVLTLHTWGRNLTLHPHIHCLITHGGLNTDGDWVEPRRKVLFPAKVMMQLFRGKFLSKVRAQEDLIRPPELSAARCRALLNKLGRTDWVVHCCKPYRHGRGVVSYLSRYVKSGPIRNRQLKSSTQERVAFKYHNHRTAKSSQQSLTPRAFILRLCDHIPQRGKPSIRYYGLYHGSRRVALTTARKLNNQAPVAQAPPIQWHDYLAQLDRLPICEVCGGQLSDLVAS